MSVKIRLRRVGAKKQPSYRVVVADSHAPRDGRFIEVIGFYNPRTKPTTIRIDEEKARKWLGNGAQPTESVASLLFRAGIADLRAPRWRKEGDTLTPPAVSAPDATTTPVAPALAATEQATAAPDMTAESATPVTASIEQAPITPGAAASTAAPTEQTALDEPRTLPGEDSGAIVDDAGGTPGADTTTAL